MFIRGSYKVQLKIEKAFFSAFQNVFPLTTISYVHGKYMDRKFQLQFQCVFYMDTDILISGNNSEKQNNSFVYLYNTYKVSVCLPTLLYEHWFSAGNKNKCDNTRFKLILLKYVVLH